MLSSLLFTVNSLLPIFALIGIGWLLKRTKFINESFTSSAEKLVFNIALPFTYVLELSEADLSVILDLKYISFCIIGMIIECLVLFFTVPLFIKDNRTKSAFIQGAVRSNFVILGLPLVENMFGGEGVSVLTSVLPFTIIIYNTFAVAVFSIYSPDGKKASFKESVKKIFLTIIKNPQIIGTIIGILLLCCSLHLPQSINKTLTYISNLASPIALMCIGANLTAESMKQKAVTSVVCSLLKVLVIPLAVMIIALPLGFRNAQLAVIFILFGSPCSTTGYIMAKAMDSDYHLSSNTILISTVLSVFTIFIGVFTLNCFGLI